MENITLKEIIKNAIKTCKKDGYNQVIYLDTDIIGYAFSRDYPNNTMYNKSQVLGRIIGSWESGIYKVKYIKEC